jgi:protein disulfide-isomerase A6
MNADDEKNKPLAAKYGVSSYPTIKFFGNGADKTPEDYNGGRSEALLVEFLNEKCGAQRAVGGGLNAQVSTQYILQPSYFEGAMAGYLDFITYRYAYHAFGSLYFMQAGRVADLDAIAKQFVAAAKDARATLLKDATALAGKAGDVAKHYVRAMEKLAGGAEAYIEKESKR